MKMQKMMGCPCPTQVQPEVAVEMEPQMNLAMITVPIQVYTTILPPCEALKCGTVFSDLSRPYCPKKR